MGEALRDDGAEIDHIEALEAALAAIDPQAADHPTLARKDRLYSELFAVRRRRIERMSEENWQRLERLVGQKLRR